MQNQQLSDVKGKELVAAGHALANAIGMDTPLIEIAKMMAALATRLDCALVRGDDLQMQRDALAAENAALARYFSASAGAVEHWNSWADADDKLASEPETPATDAYLNSVRAEGVERLLAFLPPHYTARADIEQFAAQLRAGEPS